MATSLMILGISVMAQASAFRGDSKIGGGFNITLDRVPFLVSIQEKGLGHYCGGSLITLKHVLTACHCAAVVKIRTKHKDIVLRNRCKTRPLSAPADDIESFMDNIFRNVSRVYVVAGVENVVTPNRTDPFHQRRLAKRLAFHPKCEQIKVLYYDFGLVYVKIRFEKSEKVNPFIFNLQLARTNFGGNKSNDPGPDEEKCYVAGWGATNDGSILPSNQSKAARMRIITDQECSKAYSRKHNLFINYTFLTDAQMCGISHGHQQNDSDCSGDSGGPFYCNNTVFGVISYGYDCGNWDMPHVYAKLLFAIEWLQDEKVIQNAISERRNADIGHLSHSFLLGRLVVLSFFLIYL